MGTAGQAKSELGMTKLPNDVVFRFNNEGAQGVERHLHTLGSRAHIKLGDAIRPTGQSVPEANQTEYSIKSGFGKKPVTFTLGDELNYFQSYRYRGREISY